MFEILVLDSSRGREEEQIDVKKFFFEKYNKKNLCMLSIQTVGSLNLTVTVLPVLFFFFLFCAVFFNLLLI